MGRFKKKRKLKTYNGRRHPFHIVNKSPWPILLSISLFSFIVFGISILHNYNTNFDNLYLFKISGYLIIVIKALWWRDVIREGLFEGCHTKIVASSLRSGVVWFIVSEVMFFVGFFWAFFHSSLAPVVQIGCVWPPVHLPVLEPFATPLVNTLILLFSGVTLTLAHHTFMAQGKVRYLFWLLDKIEKIPANKMYSKMYDTAFFLGLTIILGIFFTVLQILEYKLAPFNISDGIYGSCFYMATGFHGFHVIIGTLFLLVTLYRYLHSEFSPGHHVCFEAAAWYWHFVDVVWLFLFLTVYWWGNKSIPSDLILTK